MDAKTRIAEIEKRRAARQDAAAAAREEQLAQDLEALDALEEEHGAGIVARLDTDRHVPGQPTLVVLRAPTKPEYKRFVDQVNAAVKKESSAGRKDAQDLLARACWVYPAGKPEQDAMLEAFPGLLVSIALRATELVQAQKADEGKG